MRQVRIEFVEPGRVRAIEVPKPAPMAETPVDPSSYFCKSKAGRTSGIICSSILY